jgi:hypothetical protein
MAQDMDDGTAVAVGGRGGQGNAAGTPAAGGRDRDTGDFSIAPLAWLAGGAGIVGLALFTARLALRLPSGLGIEDLLGWSRPDSVAAAVQLWCQFALRWRTAAAYTLADSALFVPLYASLLLAALQGLRGALRTAPGLVARAAARLLPTLGVACIGALVLLDLAENFLGALRLGVGGWAAAASTAVGVALFAVLWRWASAPAARRDAMLCQGLAALLAAAMAVVALVAVADASGACARAAHGQLGAPGAWVHAAKPLLVGLALLPLAVASTVWWFGLDLDLAQDDQRAEANFRAAWRAGVAGVVGRSRYVLAVLAVFGLFTLGLDQCRDVLLGLAYPDPAASDAALWWRRAVQGLCAVAVGMLSYSCWMWARLAGMVQRPGLTLTADPVVAEQVGSFARGWARALALVPLALVAALVAYTVGDAVTAALRAARPDTVAGRLGGTLVGLLGFGAAAIGFGLFLLQLRRRLALARAADYYNSEPDLYRLLWGDSPIWQRRAVVQGGGGIGGLVFEGRTAASTAPCLQRGIRALAWLAPVGRALGRWLWPLAHPVWWPLAALALMAWLRMAMAGWPDTTAQAPATLALLALALNWWLGASGLLAMAEQRRAVAWSLALLLAIAIVSALGWADNHRLPLRAPRSDALATLRWHGVAAMGVLLLLAAGQWLVFCYRKPATDPDDKHPRLFARWSTPRFNLVRSLFAFALAIAAALAIKGIDQLGAPLAARADTRTPGPRQPPGQSLASWVLQLPSPAPPDPTVLLVAAEGGGIRSAYWTAQVLARLHDADPSVDRRIAALSGVSGGAVGIAAYRACLAQTAPGGSVRACIETGFRRLDSLSPLVAGLLFEDAFARVLPTTLKLGPIDLACHQPGCTHLSRALPFEREWIRRFDHLGDSLGDLPAGAGHPVPVPPLMLNSTWVESGNRAVLGSFDALPLPASNDLVTELGAWPPLITAAHASARFPFVNPLAALPPEPGATRSRGHLVDGGYHDNSGTESLADLWRSLQTALPPPWRARLLLIRNGQPRIDCERAPRDGPPVVCLDPHARPSDAELRADLLRAADRPRLDLLADLFGPLVALVNVSGVGAHGRQAPAALATTLAAQPNAEPPLFYDQLDNGDLVPLGWYLSPAAREALEGQAALYFQPGRTPP